MEPSSNPRVSLIRRLWDLARRHWIITTIGVAAAIGVGIWLIFFYFAVHLLFVDDEVDEALPTFGASEPAAPAPAPEPTPPAPDTASPASPSDAPAPPPAAAPPAGDTTSEAPAPAPAGEASAPAPAPAGETAAEAPAAAPAPAPAPVPAPAPADVPEEVMVAGPGASGMPGDEITQERADAMNEEMASGAMPREVSVDEEMPMPPEEPQIVTLVSGEFTSRSHETSGRALVLNDGSEQRFLRFEDFRTDNGPDVNVYLSSAPPNAPAGALDDDFVDLGDMKGNVGAQNYEIPPSVDLDHYSTVVVWCVRFAVAFGVAGLA